MKKYKMITIVASEMGVVLWSTDSQIINWLVAEVTKIVPTCKVKSTRKLPSSDDVCMCALEKLQNEDHEVLFFITKKLCEYGWEPFANLHGAASSYSFRFEESQ